ncbi:MAG: ribonuclease D [Acidobacteria bacterium]|nr:ribonuclease D [Acidobacteriota bacterium]
MIWIDSAEGLGRLLEVISRADLVAIDTEADSLHSYFDKVCLMQITAAGEDWIVDPLAGFPIAPIGEVLASETCVKVFHGADYDLRILNRDFGFEIRNLRDTMVCAQLLGYEAIGLAALLDRHFGLKLDKTHQRADWSQRPLTPDMLRYAATDTHYLAELVAKLEVELREKGRWEWALEEFARLEQIRHAESVPDPEAFRKLKNIGRFNRRQLAALARIHAWRDGVARKVDRPPFKVVGNDTLVAIAEALPQSVRELKLIRGMTAGQGGRHGTGILLAVSEALALPESELPELVAKKQWIRDKMLEQRIDLLRAVRDELAKDLEIEPGVLAPRHVLTAIATDRPSQASALASIPAMRRWQIDVAGERLVAAIQPTL